MLAADDLIALVRAYNPRTDENLLRVAYDYGRAAHEGQFRHSGEPYFSHPVAVAAILTQQKLDDATIITALLHDTIEDTKASYGEVADIFGRDIADLVDGVTKLTKLQLSSTETQQAENFRKLLMAMSKDLRVILVKLADRLHNMRTIRAMRQEKQVQKARETMDIFAPLAGRMGMQWMREELEDLAFKVLNPEARQSILRRFITLQSDAGDVIERITADMRIELKRACVEAEVLGRAKKPYSIWRKMQEKGQGFSRLSDIYGFRIITAGGRCRGGSRITSASPSRTATARFTPPCRAATASGWRSRSAPARCTRWRKRASPRTGPTGTACGPKTPSPSTR
jgi:GTP pyrophosphokinase/guanosine-3',5'-bis(diphosphate) 3'-pyrophosphohydrolase